MSGMKGKLAALYAMSMMFDRQGSGLTDVRPEDINVIECQPKPPKGTKEYWFDKHGNFHNGDGSNKIRKDEVVFYCYAINDKSAKKKFNKFINP